MPLRDFCLWLIFRCSDEISSATSSLLFSLARINDACEAGGLVPKNHMCLALTHPRTECSFLDSLVFLRAKLSLSLFLWRGISR